MGLFYTNVCVYKPQRTKLIDALRQLNRVAFVSPTIGGHTVVFDEAMDHLDFDVIEELGCVITKSLSCSAVGAALHDDDVLYLWLFQHGQIRDHYNSSPAYYDADAEPAPPTGGDARLLCAGFDRAGREQRVEQLLRADLIEDELSGIPSDFERHAALAHELGMPPFVAGVCFSSIAGDYVPQEFFPPPFTDIEFDSVNFE